MKQILFDLTCIEDGEGEKNHGGKTYAINLLGSIANKVDKNINVVVFSSDTVNSLIYPISVKEKLKPILIQRNDSHSWANFDTAENIIFFPLPYKQLSIIQSIRNASVFITLHGLRSIEIKTDYYKIKYKRTLFQKCMSMVYVLFSPILKKFKVIRYRRFFSQLRNNTIILTDSNYSKKSIEKHFKSVLNTFSVKVRVLIPPFSLVERNFHQREKSNFILLVSGNRYEKNVIRYLDSISVEPSMKKVKVVVTGCDNWFKTELYKRYKHKFLEIEIFNYLSTDQLNSLYSQCALFVYPSLHEGFGYPVIEALSLGAKVLASDKTSIPEVGGKVVFYLNPYDKNDMKLQTLKSLQCKDYSQNDKFAQIRKIEQETDAGLISILKELGL